MAITRQTRAQEDKAAARQKLGAEHKSPQANLTFGTEARITSRRVPAAGGKAA